MYRILYSEGVGEDLEHVTAGAAIVGLAPPWEHVEPVWELRIGEYRVFYDVDQAGATVAIRAIRHKPPHKTTEEIL